ncbi:ankyrin repeat protein [Micromonospora pisi]|uniref:Ankyrin repeat protein n=1 Tax=Micromonospora pisi TaxID=589240 RepID=A0A495JHC2_9ACTN|nr:ankyrin repeat domain-containing protein [Micromonospora pisi]RKR88171.1 ankyrin repeat protein [Micromonospora pisi]
MAKSDDLDRDELHYAALRNDVDLIRQRLAAGVPVSMRERREGYTPLHFAAQDGAAAAVDALLSAGADVDALSNRGQSPLWLAVMNSRRAPDGVVVRTLLEHGADRNLRDQGGQSPLELAQRIHPFPLEWFDEVPEGKQ